MEFSRTMIFVAALLILLPNLVVSISMLRYGKCIKERVPVSDSNTCLRPRFDCQIVCSESMEIPAGCYIADAICYRRRTCICEICPYKQFPKRPGAKCGFEGLWAIPHGHGKGYRDLH